MTDDKKEVVEQSAPLITDFIESLGLKLLHRVRGDGKRIDYEEEDDARIT